MNKNLKKLNEADLQMVFGGDTGTPASKTGYTKDGTPCDDKVVICTKKTTVWVPVEEV
jgi:hypothetical protein